MSTIETENLLLKPNRRVGISGYGAYVPRYRLPAREVSRVWTGGAGELPIKEKSVPGLDEDVATMSIEAARNALSRSGVDPQHIRAVWVGSESHPYAVKPTSTLVAELIGATPNVQAGDWEFACKAGTEAMVAAIAFVGSGMANYALAIGMDTAQGRPGDALEYTAGAGGAAYIFGPAEDSLAEIECTYSYVTDTPDFWRRLMPNILSTGSASLVNLPISNTLLRQDSAIMEASHTRPSDFKYAVFHQPNTKFPQRAASMLGFHRDQITTGLLVPVIGNTYAGAAIIGLTAILDIAEPGDRIFMVSFGSGAGSDAFILRVTDKILERRDLAAKTWDYINRRTEIDYATYTRLRGKLTLK